MAMAVPEHIPIGFRLKPTHKEVCDDFLYWRNLGQDFSMYVPDIDVTKLEPWELRDEFKDILNYQRNEKKWWFFSPRTRNQKTRRQTGSGKWSSTCGDKKIPDNQPLGIKKTFAFHLLSGASYKRDKWILHEYHLSNLPLPDKETHFVLCCLKEKDDRAKNKTGGEVGHSGSSEIDQQEVGQTNGEISSPVVIRNTIHPRKRAKESMDATCEPVNEDSIFLNSSQDGLLYSYHPESTEVSPGVPQLVESSGNNSSSLDPSWGGSRGIGSSGCVNFDRDNILSDPLENQTPLLNFDEEIETFLRGVAAADSLEGSPFESLLQQDGLFGDSSISAQQNTCLLKREAQSAKSLTGVVPAEEKKASVENRNAKPRPSPPVSPSIVLQSKGFKASNYSASAESYTKAKVVKEELTAANPPWKKTSIIKAEEDEKLAKETKEKLRLKSRPKLKCQCQNQHPLALPPSEDFAGAYVIVSIVIIIFIYFINII